MKSWVSEGAGVSQVQKKLESEFGISMTYMDVRFLLDDIDAQLKEPVRDVAPEDALTAPLPGRDSEENAENGGASAGAGAAGEKVSCPKCGASVKAGAKFCPECGTKMGAETCPKCGASVRAGAKFCPECGTKLGAAACPKCGASVKAGAKFCPECGEKL